MRRFLHKFRLCVQHLVIQHQSFVRQKNYWEVSMTDWQDPIVTEVRCIREEQAAELNYDLSAIFERARRRQLLSKLVTVSFVEAAEHDNHVTRAEVSPAR